MRWPVARDNNTDCDPTPTPATSRSAAAACLEIDLYWPAAVRYLR
jgi:hypothetical protein